MTHVISKGPSRERRTEANIQNKDPNQQPLDAKGFLSTEQGKPQPLDVSKRHVHTLDGRLMEELFAGAGKEHSVYAGPLSAGWALLTENKGEKWP